MCDKRIRGPRSLRFFPVGPVRRNQNGSGRTHDDEPAVTVSDAVQHFGCAGLCCRPRTPVSGSDNDSPFADGDESFAPADDTVKVRGNDGECWSHSSPLNEVRIDPAQPTATKRPLPRVMLRRPDKPRGAWRIHFVPSGEVRIVCRQPTATNCFPSKLILRKSSATPESRRQNRSRCKGHHRESRLESCLTNRRTQNSRRCHPEKSKMFQRRRRRRIALLQKQCRASAR